MHSPRTAYGTSSFSDWRSVPNAGAARHSSLFGGQKTEKKCIFGISSVFLNVQVGKGESRYVLLSCGPVTQAGATAPVHTGSVRPE